MEVNFFDPAVVADPYPWYERLRDQGPVVRNDLFNMWMVVGHDEARVVLKDTARFSSTVIATLSGLGTFVAAQSMMSSDPPDHSRLRSVAQRAFTPRVVAGLEDRVRATADALLAPYGPGDVLEAVGGFAFPLSLDTIAELLGVAPGDRSSLNDWSEAILVGTNLFCTAEEAARSQAAGVAIRDYFAAALADRRGRPGQQDLIGRLVAANDDETLDDAELLGTCVLLIVAGHETSAKLIGNAIRCLATGKIDRTGLLGDRASADQIVEEALRYTGPPQATVRVALADAELGGAEIKAGDLVLPVLAAANRDPAAFPGPDSFDATRPAGVHLAFGHGAHYCIGASLARAELRVALQSLLRKAPNVTLSDPAVPPDYGSAFFIRGLTRLEVTLR